MAADHPHGPPREAILTADQWNERYPYDEYGSVPVWYQAAAGRRVAITRGAAVPATDGVFFDRGDHVNTYPCGWMPLAHLEPIPTDDDRRQQGWLPPNDARALARERDIYIATDAAYWGVKRAIDDILGPDSTDGGLIERVQLLAQQRDRALADAMEASKTPATAQESTRSTP